MYIRVGGDRIISTTISVIITGSVHYIPLLIVQSELPEVERRPPAEEDVVARLPEVPTEPPTLGRL